MEEVLDWLSTVGLAGITVSAMGGTFEPPSSRSPWPTSSLHCTFFEVFNPRRSLSDVRLYGCAARLERRDFRGVLCRPGEDTEVDDDRVPYADDRLDPGF